MAWAMAWVGHQIVRNPLALFDSNNFHPYPQSLAFGDHLLPEGLLGLPINLLTGNSLLALNLVTAFGLFSTALAAWVAASRILGSRSAGLLCGTFAAFNSFTQSELLRVNVLHLQGWFLALLILWRFVESPSWKHGWLFSLALALQGLTGTYYAVYSAILVPGLVGAAYLGARVSPRRADALRLLAPALLVGLAGWVFLSPYRDVAVRSLAQKPIPDGADIASYLLPNHSLWLPGGWLPSPPRGESNHFLGFIPLALAVVGLASFLREPATAPSVRRFVVFVGLWMLAIGGFISIGAYPRIMGEPLGTSPYLYILQSFPVLRGMATVERAGVLVQIGVALLAASGAARVFQARRSWLAPLTLATLAAAEQWTRPGPGIRVPAGSEVPPVYRYLALGSGPVVEAPVFPDRLLRFRALYPYFSTYHWRPVPLGRASFYPPAHDYFASLMQSFPDPVSIEALRVMGIFDVVVHPRMWTTDRAEKLRALEGDDFQLLETFPGDVSPSAAALDLGEERVYRLRGGPRSSPGCEPGGELESDAFIFSSNASEGLARLRDNDAATGWSTVRPQEEGDFLEVRLPGLRTIAAVRMALGARPSEFPIGLRIEAQGPGDAFAPAHQLESVTSAAQTLSQLIRSDPRAAITLRIRPVETRAIRLLLEKDPERPFWNPWSVAEIQIFSECSSAAGQALE